MLWTTSLLKGLTQKGFFHLVGANLFTQIVGFASQFLVAWLIPPVDIGRLRILQSFGGLATVAGKLGFDSSTLKLCSETRPPGEKRSLFVSAVRFASVASFVVMLLMFLLNSIGVLSSDHRVSEYLCYYLPIVIALSLTDVLVCYLQALKLISLMSNIQIVTRSVSLIAIVLLTYLFGAEGYVIGLVGASYLGLVWLYRFVHKHNKLIPKVELPNAVREHWHYAKFSFPANTLGQLNTFLDILVLNYLVSDRVEIGYYGFALILLIPFNTLTTSVQQISTPYFSESSAQFDVWKSMYRKYQRLFVIGSGGLTFLSLLTVPPVIGFVMQNKFDDSLPYFSILLVGWFIRNWYSLKGVALWGLGKIRLNFIASAIAIPINVTLSIILTSQFGGTGAAVSSVLGQCVFLAIVSMMFQSVITKKGDSA